MVRLAIGEGVHDHAPDGLLLGAGASYELGMPLVWHLTAELRAWLTPAKLRELVAGWKLQGVRHDAEAVRCLEQSLQNPKMHYEAILGNLELGFRRPGRSQQDYHGLYGFLIEIVYMLLYYRQTRNLEYIQAGMRLMEGVAGLAKEHRPLWVFSLNHDLMVECLGATYGIPVNSGFDEQVSFPRRDLAGNIIGALGGEMLTGERFRSQGLQFPTGATYGINLIKLHGSLDVFTVNDGDDLVKLKPDNQTVASALDALRAANEDLFFALPTTPGGKVKAVNEIAYADQDGEMQFLRRTLLSGAFKFDLRSSQVLPKEMLDQFKLNLGRVRHLVSVGYGMGDQHVNNVVKSWLEFNGSHRLSIVAPMAAFPAFLLHVADQVDVIDANASDYFERFAFAPLTSAEAAMKDLRGMTRAFTLRKQGFA